MKGKCPDCHKSVKLDDRGLTIPHDIIKRISKKTSKVMPCPGFGKRPK